MHQSGFVSIIGKPNTGKSTLLNSILKENLSIVSPKAQTTRHRIKGILNGVNFQIIFSDTPGIILPQYTLHQSMMKRVHESVTDADCVLYMIEVNDSGKDDDLIKEVHTKNIPLIVLLNKIDLSTQEQVEKKIKFFSARINCKEIIPISALNSFNLEKIIQTILEIIPESEPFFPKENISDLPDRFFVAEFIREQIYLNYGKEIPYCCDIQIISFIEKEKIIYIASEIIVERNSQKGILIGKKGDKLKKILTDSRHRMEKFLSKKVFLQSFVKVEPGWRKDVKYIERARY